MGKKKARFRGLCLVLQTGGGEVTVSGDLKSALVIILTNILLAHPHGATVILEDEPLAVARRGGDHANVTVDVLDFHS